MASLQQNRQSTWIWWRWYRPIETDMGETLGYRYLQYTLTKLELSSHETRSQIYLQTDQRGVRNDENGPTDFAYPVVTHSHHIFVDLFGQLVPRWQFFVCSNVAWWPDVRLLPERYPPCFFHLPTMPQRQQKGLDGISANIAFFRRRCPQPQISRTPRRKKASG